MNTVSLLDPAKTSKLARFIDPDVMDIIVEAQGFVAGGAITSICSQSRINDVDIVFLTKGQALSACRKAKDLIEFDKKPLDLDTCLSFFYKGKKYQFIKMNVGGPSQIISSHDFTICQCAWIPGANHFIATESFLPDLAARSLVFNLDAKFPISSLCRVRKFIKKGFYISGIEMIKIALSVQKLPLETYAELKEQLMGIDTLILKDLTDALESRSEVDYEFNKFMELINEYFVKYYGDLLDD